VRRLLLLDVLTHDFDGRAAARAREVGRRPQGTAPKFPANARVVLLADHPARNAFQTIHQRRYSDLGRVVHKQMHMAVFTVELYQLGFEVAADVREDHTPVVYHFPGEDPVPILRDKDQMCMHAKYAVPSMPQVRVHTAWSAYCYLLRSFKDQNMVCRMELPQAFRFELVLD
jgi:hypothetical protein